MKRVFVIVLDSAGIGSAPDAADFGDSGADTFGSCYKTGLLNVPNMAKLGLFNIDGVSFGTPVDAPEGVYGRLCEVSRGKDTTIGHWEIAGVVSGTPLPVFSQGFPEELIERFGKACGRKIICNKNYSGTKVIADYGREHMETGALIVYTSIDSVFQIAAHEDIVPPEELYNCCRIARGLLTGEYAVGRVIARPFTGKYPDFVRTSGRHDFSLKPPAETMLDVIKAAGKDVIAVGKISDIFAGMGVTESVRINGNDDGMDKTLSYARDKDFNGLCFVNLVDFDMVYGHRRNPTGYTEALNAFDVRLGELLGLMRADDALIITADHGCDPCYKGTDHTRECTPYLMYSKNAEAGNIGTKEGYTYISEEVCKMLGVKFEVKMLNNGAFGQTAVQNEPDEKI